MFVKIKNINNNNILSSDSELKFAYKTLNGVKIIFKPLDKEIVLKKYNNQTIKEFTFVCHKSAKTEIFGNTVIVTAEDGSTRVYDITVNDIPIPVGIPIIKKFKKNGYNCPTFSTEYDNVFIVATKNGIKKLNKVVVIDSTITKLSIDKSLYTSIELKNLYDGVTEWYRVSRKNTISEFNNNIYYSIKKIPSAFEYENTPTKFPEYAGMYGYIFNKIFIPITRQIYIKELYNAYLNGKLKQYCNRFNLSFYENVDPTNIDWNLTDTYTSFYRNNLIHATVKESDILNLSDTIKLMISKTLSDVYTLPMYNEFNGVIFRDFEHESSKKLKFIETLLNEKNLDYIYYKVREYHQNLQELLDNNFKEQFNITFFVDYLGHNNITLLCKYFELFRDMMDSHKCEISKEIIDEILKALEYIRLGFVNKSEIHDIDFSIKGIKHISNYLDSFKLTNPFI